MDEKMKGSSSQRHCEDNSKPIKDGFLHQDGNPDVILLKREMLEDGAEVIIYLAGNELRKRLIYDVRAWDQDEEGSRT